MSRPITTLVRRLLKLLLRLGIQGAGCEHAATVPAMGRRLQTTAPVSAADWSGWGPSPKSPLPRRHMLASVGTPPMGALIAASIVFALASCGSAPVSAGSQATATHGAQASPSAGATASEAATVAPTPSQFVCANPQGSSLTYTYVRGDGNLYAVTACGQPRPLVTGNRYPLPVAWSPGNHYLAVDVSSSQGPGDAIIIVNAQMGQSVATQYMLAGIGYAGNLNPGQSAKLFLGWLNDDLFVAADVPLLDGPTGSNTGPATIVTVDRTTQKETKVGTVTWFADAKVRADMCSMRAIRARARAGRICTGWM